MHWREMAQTVVITIAALLASVAIYSVFIYLYAGVAPRDLFYQIYRGGWSDTFPISNTLTKAAPLILTALCTALPARVGLINIGAEGALMLGGLAAACTGLAMSEATPLVAQIAMVLAGMFAGGLLIAAVGLLRTARGVNETISSLLMTYIAIAVFNYLVEGPLRDPASLNKPSTHPLPEDVMIGTIVPESGVIHDFLMGLGSWMKVFGDVHVGLLFGVIFCVLAYLLMYHTTFGFAARMVGGNVRAAQASGIPVSKVILITCFLAGAAAGLAGMVEIAFAQRQANASLNANYGFRGILVSFIARHHPLAIIPVAILFGSIDAAASVVQQDLKLPAAALDVLMGITFVIILLSETFYGRFRIFQPRLAKEVVPSMNPLFADGTILQGIDLAALGLALFGGAIRVGTPFLFVSLGECITERAGRVNLGLEGTLVMGAMTAYTVSYYVGANWLSYLATSLGIDESIVINVAPWLGVLAAGAVGALLGVMHAVICNLPRVNFVAVGIAMMVFGVGLAAYLGKAMIQPVAPKLQAFDFGSWADSEQVRFALRVNALFLVGLVLTPILAWALVSTRWGMILRLAGESEEAAAAMGYSVNTIRIFATAMGGILAGIGGSFLSLYYPGSWNESISSGQGLMAVALVIFARWNPYRCLLASLIFGGAGALGPALQAQGLSSGAVAYLWNSAPYVLTLVLMLITSSRDRAMAGAPGVLTQAR